jgi:NAD(P)-dependent dehydrogenase (short-subunit alcohol dehydrogenase family)
MKVFLTGAGGGIGQAIYEALSQNDIEVIAPGSKDLDLSKEFDVSSYPEVDGLIHCAGINPVAQLQDVKVSDIYRTYGVNTISFVELCSKLKIKHSSNIIAIGSLYATETKDGRLSYAMSKHALLGAVKTIALEKAEECVKVNMISPGFVDTPLTRKNNTEERIALLNELIPLGLVNPLEIANLCVYLLKHNNSITGHNFVVDGGYSLKGI